MINMIDFTESLKEEMDLNIRLIESKERDIIKRALAMIEMLESILNRLKEYIIAYEFQSDKEEIQFFREVKPRFFCHLLFYQKVYNIELNKPIGCLDVKEKYLAKELDQLQEYINKRLAFYRYYRSGASHLDKFYFLRGQVVNKDQYIDSFYFERDPTFSTNGDFTVSKILANDMLQVYLHGELELIGRNRYTFEQTPPFPFDIIHWTDKKAGLIEIIYALDALCSLENGNISLNGITSYFELVFGVKLGNVSRTFNEMKIRNKPTPFLDRMKEALLERMQGSSTSKKHHG